MEIIRNIRLIDFETSEVDFRQIIRIVLLIIHCDMKHLEMNK